MNKKILEDLVGELNALGKKASEDAGDEFAQGKAWAYTLASDMLAYTIAAAVRRGEP